MTCLSETKVAPSYESRPHLMMDVAPDPTSSANRDADVDVSSSPDYMKYVLNHKDHYTAKSSPWVIL